MIGKKLIFYVVILSIPFLFFEIAFQVLPTTYPPKMLQVDAQAPIARYEPNKDFQYSQGWDFAIRTTKHSNNYGFFHESDFESESSTPLLMVIGDSFVQANEVNGGESAAELLHQEVKGQGRVYSMGLSGAPLSQYLAMADFAQSTFRPDGFVFVIIRNDFDESLFEYKSDSRFHYFKKTDGKRELHRVDFPRSKTKDLLRRSAFVRYLILNLEIDMRIKRFVARFDDINEDSDIGYVTSRAGLQRFEDSKIAIEEFLDRLPSVTSASGASITFVVDGLRPELYSDKMLQESSDSYAASIRSYFIASATERGYQIIDMQPIFLARHNEDGSVFEFPTDLHWNQLGNQVVADSIEQSDLFKRIFGR